MQSFRILFGKRGWSSDPLCESHCDHHLKSDSSHLCCWNCQKQRVSKKLECLGLIINGTGLCWNVKSHKGNTIFCAIMGSKGMKDVFDSLAGGN